ncbi:uncharacterized protein JN550_002586 [Neoarthrinium moseri]|uniref:uncharacterized protein n=1 Tax=Neoarthrinium moseri TaxID=1658444 RepID=UPI001FDDFCDF|nr:uncharacterized protein JN550_002586 [Neoarthrinium moseri]KAI1874007.1 hypothetical protein JN550_002586 [Neoarthrinium moseri]
MVAQLNIAEEELLIAKEPSLKRTARYRCGYYIHPHLDPYLHFLEDIISLGFRYRPDCIFDEYDDETIHDMFRFDDWGDIWEEFLESLGINVEWAFEEDERRKRVKMGTTSAHEVQRPIQSAQDILQVQHRRPFKADPEA